MADYAHLDDVNFFDEDINALFKSWREAIENANRWDVNKGGSGFMASATTGLSLNLPDAQRGSRSAVVTVAITTGSSGTLGSGKAKFRLRTPPGLTLRDGAEVIVLNPFTISSSIPVGTIIKIDYEGPDWMLAGANC